MFRRVVLPPPDVPKIEMNSPSWTVRLTPRNAGTPSIPSKYVLCTLTILMTSLESSAISSLSSSSLSNCYSCSIWAYWAAFCAVENLSLPTIISKFWSAVSLLSSLISKLFLLSSFLGFEWTELPVVKSSWEMFGCPTRGASIFCRQNSRHTFQYKRVSLSRVYIYMEKVRSRIGKRVVCWFGKWKDNENLPDSGCCWEFRRASSASASLLLRFFFLPFLF